MWPSRVRRPERKHAFEDALDEAQLDPEGGGPLLDEPTLTAPGIGSLGDIAVASGYVGTASLARAYEAGSGQADEPKATPGDAARQLMAQLAARAHSLEELRAARRRFAAQNHPDSVAEELRAEAVTAMAEVNAEIDRALKGVRKRG